MTKQPNFTDVISREFARYGVEKNAIVICMEITQLVQTYTSGRASNHRISREVYLKLKQGLPLTIEDTHIIGASRFVANRLLQVLKYFFGGGEFHIGWLVELQLKLGNQEQFDIYCVLTKKRGKPGPKARGTIVNECRSVIMMCDMVCHVY